MSCYRPLFALTAGTKDNGKKEMKFLSYRPRDQDDVIICAGKEYPRSALVSLPCGQCIGCRIDYSRQWANRCLMELEYHDSAYFCTFTYDDAHVPQSEYVDPNTGEVLTSLSLRKKDFQLLMKRIRKRFPNDKIRFFMSGEYGSETFRPHYHAILFGLHLDDLTRYKIVREGNEYYTYYNSPSLQSCWRDHNGHDIGFVVVGEVTWNTCAYTARYVMKKLKGEAAEMYEKFGLEPEFSLMSRKPGIARQFYDDHPDLYEFDKINISTPRGGKSFRPPRYFDKLFDVENHEKLESLKNTRAQIAIEQARSKLAHTTLDSYELQEVEEMNFQNKLKQLRRTL